MSDKKFEHKVTELETIIDYFSESHSNDDWFKSEQITASGTIAFRLDELADDTFDYSEEERAKILRLSAKAIRLIACSIN
ncbi:hypothetical protein DOS74_04105 [Staphylococcus felis]|uniref:Uncharacterized protein n=1 Tax=Staphylococcus felis TaxID=46127 RepID=A0AAX1RTK7_9STAP|nr:hypothetical protein [Staphylococcus felis]REH79892.1 hypothetical protein DOS59_02545 [Staphylococcus felis]REH83582.1 hypothetical protein DOS56_05885 [Staphylococcus felis]REH87739.1 hypothetical protein DOS63_00860 [Staphylococcus felis]REI03047.1 hypothetical protein DOS64_00885 [Staphylococcus felis]REI17324.1 hypothetical protein DOS74_04105 [Staphylococcus felis]